MKQGFKKTKAWNEYRSDLARQPKNNNLYFMIDPTFNNNNKLSVPWFKAGISDIARDFSDKYQISSVDIKNWNALAGNETLTSQ